jgi:F-type H+-transporting ATPase subunit delta
VAKVTLPDSARNFLRTVIENGRLSVLPEMALQFRSLKNAQSDPRMPSSTAHSRLTMRCWRMWPRRFRRGSGRKLNVKVELEPALIGGIRVVVGDEVLDTSVKARLEQMKVALTA